MIARNKVIFNVVMIFDFEGENLSINGGFSGFEENISRHVNMCDLLLLSLLRYDMKLRIATNSIDVFKKYSKPNLFEKYSDFINLNISTIIPRGIDFFASMHKLEFAEVLSQAPDDEYNFIIDNDCVLLNPLSDMFFAVTERGIPYFYNITNQVVPAFGRNIVDSDKTYLTQENSYGSWIGGEIIGGTNQLYKVIHDVYIDKIGNFINSYNVLKQKSDENFYSIVYEKFIRNNLNIQHLSSDLIFYRFWCVKTLHFPEHWQAVKEYSILHLPSSKIFLSSYLNEFYTEDLDSEKFKCKYEMYLKSKNYTLNPVLFIEKRRKNLISRLFERIYNILK